ncbi:unnamed protein product [Brassicogethes aeneus]|uniref:EF-hand domain-containing protein n=1 Tax=Brassicogethes aeneus TaxID=1431903 RepID=A0A9P0ATZ0_BRAAE|nr:unnamed protein product [Brassicogethes aeneus]
MVFSILRSGVLTPRNVNVLKTALNGAKVEPVKSLTNVCKCLTVAPTTNFILTRNYSKRYQHKTGRKYDSDSASDSDIENKGPRGESEFWRRKMRTFHGILDVNKDGVISFDDFVLLADRFVDLGHLSEKHTKEFKKVIKELWESRWGEIYPYNLVTVEQYITDMHHILNDKVLVKKVHGFLPYLFKALDKDASGVISVEEYKLFFNCLGLKELDAELAFRTIDSNGDGKITIKEFIKHGKDFFLTEDEERISKYFWGPLIEH